MTKHFKYEEVEYDRKESTKWALISIGLMVLALYLAFLTFMFWFVSQWQFTIVMSALILCLVGAYRSFRRI